MQLHVQLFRLLCFLLFVAIAPCAWAADRPNVMVFLVDDMGVMDTSVPFLTDKQGKPQRFPLNEFYRTPNMQRLAESGIRFNQFYAMSVCSPTRVSIMTGQNAARHRTTNWINPRTNNAGTNGPEDWNWAGLNASDVTLPGLLREVGYRTIHVGKGHFGAEGKVGAEPLNLGFDVNVAGASFGAPGSYYGEKDYGAATKRSHHAVPHLKKYHGTETFLSEALTIEAKRRVSEAVSQGEPFYLYFSHYAVHGPFDSDPRYADHYRDSGKPAPAQAFATLIEGMDKSLGDMLDHLETLGIAENTLVLFLGDNGTDAPLGDQHQVACAAPLRGKKGAHYEGGMRVPFIASWAKRDIENVHQRSTPIAAGEIQSQVASVCDLFPTVLEVAGGLHPPAHLLDGESLRALWDGRLDEDRRESFLMHYPHGRHRSNYFTVWRDGPWKVVYHALPEKPTTGGNIQFRGGNYELFRLDRDPYESTNLADSHRNDLRRMMQGMVAALKDYEALYPVDDDGKVLHPKVPE